MPSRTQSYRDDGDQRGSLTAFRKNDRFDTITAAAFTLLWNGGIAFLFQWMPNALLNLSPFIAVGVGLAYLTAAASVNRVSITVSDGEVRAEIGPLPWRGGFRIAPGLVRKIAVVPVWGSDNPNAVERIELVFSTTDGGRELKVGDARRNARAHHIAALLREELALERVENDDSIAVEGARIAVRAVTDADEAQDAAANANDPERRRR